MGDHLQEAVDAYAKHGSKATAAREIGVSPSTFKDRLNEAIRKGYKSEKMQGTSTLYAPIPTEEIQAPDPPQKPTVRVRLQHDDHADHYVMAIGDAHDSPRLSKERFRWMGCEARREKPDCIIQIGDFLTLDSLCRYDPNDTVKGKEKPTYLEDMESGNEALEAFNDGLNEDTPKHVTLGNHEDRVFSFTDRHPEIAGYGQTQGMMQHELDRLFTKHGWSYSPFGYPYYLGGVAFIHAPMSILGKPMGGENVLANVTLKSTHDWIFGHDHRAGAYSRPKIGPNNQVTAIDLGCSLPEGHVEPYARLSTTGWWYGVWFIRLSKGRIQSYRRVTMSELRDRHG